MKFLVASAVRLVDDEAEHLALLHVVKTHDADVALRVFLAASLNFSHDFLDAASTKQRQLPQSPVAHFSSRGFVEFYAGNVALIQDVLQLLGDLGVCQRGQIGQSFVTTLFW